MEHEFIIGRNPVLEALKSGRDINKLWIAEGSQGGSMGQITQLAKRNGVLVQFVPKKKIEQMVDGIHQGSVCRVR
jgi:23S rRNA (guanosine2251-2'-O)-methyltransferase